MLRNCVCGTHHHGRLRRQRQTLAEQSNVKADRTTMGLQGWMWLSLSPAIPYLSNPGREQISKPIAYTCALAHAGTLQSGPLLMVGHGLHPLTPLLRGSLILLSYSLPQPIIYPSLLTSVTGISSGRPYSCHSSLKFLPFSNLPSPARLIQITYLCPTGIVRVKTGGVQRQGVDVL